MKIIEHGRRVGLFIICFIQLEPQISVSLLICFQEFVSDEKPEEELENVFFLYWLIENKPELIGNMTKKCRNLK